MGLLVDGQWVDQWYDTESTGGKFVRSEAQFRHWISNEPGNEFVPQSNRYHLYVSLACPWAHRTLILRKLKNLEAHIGLSIVHPDMLDEGWMFTGPDLNSQAKVGDQLFSSLCYHEIYTRAQSDYSGRVTVPVLWDTKTNIIVSNESAEIIQMFNSAFNGLTGNTIDFAPAHLQSEMDDLNERVYHTVNNGVYKCGFASSQEAYQDAFGELFETLAWLESRLAERRFLLGDQITLADWRLFTTLIRFDAVYVGHFKCNLKRIADYPNLSNYLRELYQIEGIAETVDLEHIKRHYYFSHRGINPHGVIPIGPELDFNLPHDRTRL
jgi:glutathionyl-hydroquinone reductase